MTVITQNAQNAQKSNIQLNLVKDILQSKTALKGTTKVKLKVKITNLLFT